MNLFCPDNNYSDDEGGSNGAGSKRRLRKRMNRDENDPVFKGKVNLSLKELQNADELWLVKVPKSFRHERLEGHEIVLENEAENTIELNNGTNQTAQVTKGKFDLPFVCPQSSKDRVSGRVEKGLKVERAIESGSQDVSDLEEEAETVSLSFKGKVVFTRQVSSGKLPKPQPEEIPKIVQPRLKRRHPFFGLDSPPAPINGEKSSKKRKKRSI